MFTQAVSKQFNGVMSSSLLTHDIWHPKALGKSAYSGYQYLLSNGAKAVLEISEGINKSETSVRNALERLEERALVDSQ